MAKEKMTDAQKKSANDKRSETLKLKTLQAETDRIQSLRDRELLAIRNQPESSRTNIKYQYKVGDVVNFRSARFSHGTIIEVLDNGSSFLIDVPDKNSGASPDYYSHLDILPNNLELKPTMSYRDTMPISFHNSELGGLLHSYYSFKVDMNPVYQRELVWTLDDKQMLIHSIFSNIEIGKFVFIELPYAENSAAYEILDGKQRLSTLVEFYEDRFPYKGIYYSELSTRDKDHFRHYSVTQGSGKEKMTLEQKMEYFLKLNTQGRPQSAEHISKVEKMLKNLKNNS